MKGPIATVTIKTALRLWLSNGRSYHVGVRSGLQLGIGCGDRLVGVDL
jgi:hypothetical protein